MVNLAFLLSMVLGANAAAICNESDKNSKLFYRPSLHFTPAKNFMNDPNGLLYDGENYHLYYQYNPGGDVAGNTSWGHAVSTDLYHWKDLELAFTPNSDGYAYSGSAVLDTNNTSGYFSNNSGILAVYTRANANTSIQSQFLAASSDGGVSFEDKGDILNINSTQFRDPQVSWHKESNKWIMVVARARDHLLDFYSSSNLQKWELESTFGPTAILGIDYECPNLIQVPIAGTNKFKYVLFLSINPGFPLGGSGTQYFVGEFNGTAFVPDHHIQLFTDFAKDAYAMQVYNNFPNNAAVSINWLGNWQYCQEVPTTGYRSSMTLPRNMTLKSDWDGVLKLSQEPYKLDEMRSSLLVNNPLRQLNGSAYSVSVPSKPLDITLNLTATPKTASGFAYSRTTIELCAEDDECLTIGFDAYTQQMYIDRSTLRGFKHPFFTGHFSAALPPNKLDFDCRIVVDGSTLEVYAHNGLIVGTAAVFPSKPFSSLVLKSNSDVTINEFNVHVLKKTMDRETV